MSAEGEGGLADRLEHPTAAGVEAGHAIDPTERPASGVLGVAADVHAEADRLCLLDSSTIRERFRFGIAS